MVLSNPMTIRLTQTTASVSQRRLRMMSGFWTLVRTGRPPQNTVP
jgi:hypothetical protein